ncbi:MAG: hypothetical protein D6776_04220, partial [Planctomycetota bacterium]
RLHDAATALATALLLVCGSALRAETAYLRDGRVLEGRIVEERPEEIVLEGSDGRRYVLLRMEIDRLDYGRREHASDAPPPPARSRPRAGSRSETARGRQPVSDRPRPASPTARPDPVLALLRSATRTAQVLDAIARLGPQRPAPAVLAALAERTRHGQPAVVRIAALEALARYGGRVAERTLARRARSHDVRVREAAARALASPALRPLAVIAPLSELLVDPVPRVQRAARESARRWLADPRTSSLWIAALEPGGERPLRSPRARAAVLTLLAEVPGSEAFAALCRCAEGESDARCRATAVRAIAVRSERTVVAILLRTLRDPAVEVRIAAAEGLTRRGKRLGLERLLAIATDPERSAEHRRQAWRALERALGVRLAHDPAIWRAHFEARFGGE